MELIFPFKNIATNWLVEFIDEKESIFDFVLIKQDKYPYTRNFFQMKVDHFKESLPDFENEILQLINTTSQSTIDTYFIELYDNVQMVRRQISLENIRENVIKWNEETLKSYEEEVEKATNDYFKSEDRKRKHLEEYETLSFGGLLGLWEPNRELKSVKKINYNFYCIEKEPTIINDTYCEKYQVFIAELAEMYFEVARKYGIPYSNGEIFSKVEQSNFIKPVVFVEGEHDITYIKKAAEVLIEQELLTKVELRQRGGCSNLDKIWVVYKDNNWETIPQKKLLLYDCDTNNTDADAGLIHKRVIKNIATNMVTKGIENLFPNSIIEKAIQKNKAFIDFTWINRIKRGVVSEENICQVNDDEKKHLCTWICENATPEDFVNFNSIFDLIRIVS